MAGIAKFTRDDGVDKWAGMSTDNNNEQQGSRSLMVLAGGEQKGAGLERYKERRTPEERQLQRGKSKAVELRIMGPLLEQED